MSDAQGSARPNVLGAGASPRWMTALPFVILLGGGLGYAGYQLAHDLTAAPPTTWLPYLLLGVALLIALGFEFVNGFHDTANAVATVIYTHSLPPMFAVVWSGTWNFLGVLTSTGAVAFGILSLLPVELILQVGSAAGFAMVFALLIAAIIWNLGTWALGLPSSSSHTLIGSIIGVGLTNQLMSQRYASGVDWSQALTVGKSLLISPLVGYCAAAVLLLAAKQVLRAPALFRAPEGNRPPPWSIRALLIATCTGVSFAHGSNDGQKGMGLIMLILIGTVPTVYALNHAVPQAQVARFQDVTRDAVATLDAQPHEGGVAAPGYAQAHATIEEFIGEPQSSAVPITALTTLMRSIAGDVAGYPTLASVPPATARNLRNDMYLVDEALRQIDKNRRLGVDKAGHDALAAYRKALDSATKFIPLWVKVAVAMALGLGTMIGWKRIVVTVGERIGKSHLNYAQGASAELVAMATIGAADAFGLPVSTTHVLSSGVAGAMTANGSGLQMRTLRNLVMAWVLTLPASIVLAGLLYWGFRQLI